MHIHIQEWASLVTHNLPAMRETWDQSLAQEDLLKKGIATHASVSYRTCQNLNLLPPLPHTMNPPCPLLSPYFQPQGMTGVTLHSFFQPRDPTGSLCPGFSIITTLTPSPLPVASFPTNSQVRMSSASLCVLDPQHAPQNWCGILLTSCPTPVFFSTHPLNLSNIKVNLPHITTSILS